MKTSDSFGDKIDQATEKMRPLLASTSQFGGIVVSIFHTAQIMLTMVPFILSSVALFVAFPGFFEPLSTVLKYGITIIISLLAGYQTYSNYKFRERHDALIIENQKEIDELKAELTSLKESLKPNGPEAPASIEKSAPITPSFERQRTDAPKENPGEVSTARVPNKENVSPRL